MKGPGWTRPPRDLMVVTGSKDTVDSDRRIGFICCQKRLMLAQPGLVCRSEFLLSKL